jgi:4-amino-4-deoxy-L-arabinose transferase-like glycosyltransferase
MLLKSMELKSKILWEISMLVLFGISYWLCRYTFFHMHGMKQWTNLLAVIGITILVVATLFGNRIIPVASIIGYLCGFILAMLLSTDGVDQGGGRTNNAWIIWGMIYIFSILIGFILSCILKNKPKIN